MPIYPTSSCSVCCDQFWKIRQYNIENFVYHNSVGAKSFRFQYHTILQGISLWLSMLREHAQFMCTNTIEPCSCKVSRAAEINFQPFHSGFQILNTLMVLLYWVASKLLTEMCVYTQTYTSLMYIVTLHISFF